MSKQTFEELSVDLIGVRSAWGRWYKNGGKSYFHFSLLRNRWDFRGTSSFHRRRKWHVEEPGWRFVIFLVILGWLYWNSRVFMKFFLSYFESWVPWSQYHASDWAFPDCSELFLSYFWALLFLYQYLIFLLIPGGMSNICKDRRQFPLT